jgi:hypothetical protein
MQLGAGMGGLDCSAAAAAAAVVVVSHRWTGELAIGADEVLGQSFSVYEGGRASIAGAGVRRGGGSR